MKPYFHSTWRVLDIPRILLAKYIIFLYSELLIFEYLCLRAMLCTFAASMVFFYFGGNVFQCVYSFDFNLKTNFEIGVT